jgi:HEPN domain-containing protein
MSATMAVDPRQWSEARRWLARVDDDLPAAEALLGLALPAVGVAAFHCQQAAEKMAKAVLIALHVSPPKLHDTAELGRRIKAHHAALGEGFGELGGLTRWYVSARYPEAGIEDVPSVEDMRDVLLRLHRLRRRIDELAPD